MELLRILAMLLVLIVHADFYSLGAPGPTDFAVSPAGSVTRVSFEFISIVGVNVFVLISGWFGIRPTVRGAAKLIFQCSFFGLLAYAILLYLHLKPFSVMLLAGAVTGSRLWFVPAYLALMVVAPALNAFVQSVPRKKVKAIIIAFFVFQTAYANIGLDRNPFLGGYSVFSFIGLYLLARYINEYKLLKHTVISSPPKFILLFFICVSVNVCLYYVLVTAGYRFEYVLTQYINPLNIIGALALMLAFASMKPWYNKLINLVGASAFAVYLLHCSLLQSFSDLMLDLYGRFPGFGYVLAAGTAIIAIYILSVALDQIRILLWNSIVLVSSKFKSANV